MRLMPEETALAERLKAALTPATKSRTYVGRAPDIDAASALLEEVFALGEDRAHGVMTRAVKGSKKREEALIGLLLTLGDAGAPIADAFLLAILADPGHPRRNHLVQVVQFTGNSETAAHARRRFTNALCRIAAVPDDPESGFAVITLGTLGDPAATDTLMDLTQGAATPFSVLTALRKIAPPEAIIVFEMMSLHPPDRRHEIAALWGLGKLQSLAAIGALIDALDDPVIKTETRFDPGVGGRAAQALIDIHGWDAPAGNWRTEVAFAKEAAAQTYPDWFTDAARLARKKGYLFDSLDEIRRFA